jgi:uncharacterized damage-inducible protein DinB
MNLAGNKSKSVHTMKTTETQQSLFVNMALAAWDSQNQNLNKLIATLSEDQLSKQIAPGKNTGIYLLGHLVAVNDGMLPILDLGERLFPKLQRVFISSPDKSGMEKPTVDELKKSLEVINAKLAMAIQATSTAEWFQKHTAVSDEDFAKEPHRNKLNIMLNRTNHMSYHLGQMALLKEK